MTTEEDSFNRLYDIVFWYSSQTPSIQSYKVTTEEKIESFLAIPQMPAKVLVKLADNIAWVRFQRYDKDDNFEETQVMLTLLDKLIAHPLFTHKTYDEVLEKYHWATWGDDPEIYTFAGSALEEKWIRLHPSIKTRREKWKDEWESLTQHIQT